MRFVLGVFMSFGTFFSSCLGQCWRFMDGFNIPGIGITPAAVLLGLVGIYASVFILSNLISLGSGVVSLSNSFNKRYQLKRRGSNYDD